MFNFFDNELEFYSNSSISNDCIKYTQPVFTFDLNIVKKVLVTYNYGLTRLWYIVASGIMITPDEKV